MGLGHWWYELGAPLGDQSSIHKPFSLRYVNNSSSHVILLKAEEKQRHSSCFLHNTLMLAPTHLRHRRHHHLLFPSSRGMREVLEPLNRSLSFFPHEKALFISHWLAGCFRCSRLEKFAVPEEGGGGGWPVPELCHVVPCSLPVHILPAVAIQGEKCY